MKNETIKNGDRIERVRVFPSYASPDVALPDVEVYKLVRGDGVAEVYNGSGDRISPEELLTIIFQMKMKGGRC